MKLLLTLVLLLCSDLVFAKNKIQALMDKYGDRVVLVHSDKIYGTGFMTTILGKKVLVSAGHVCENANFDNKDNQYLNVQYKSIKYKAKILTSSLKTDLCLLEPHDKIPTFKLTKKPVKREKLLSVGFAGGVYNQSHSPYFFEGYLITYAYNLEQVFKEHIEITSKKECERLGPNYKIYKNKERLIVGAIDVRRCRRNVKYYATTIPGSGGISGGPTINMNGEVVGINYSTFGRSNILGIVPYYEIEILFKEYMKGK